MSEIVVVITGATGPSGGGGGGVSALDDLTDVTISTPSNGQVLKYNGTAWVNGTDDTGGGGGGGPTALDDLTDVTITAAAAGDILRHNGTAWVDAVGTTHFEAAGGIATHAAVTSSVHGISAFGATLVDDADAATARTTLGLGALATLAGIRVEDEGTSTVASAVALNFVGAGVAVTDAGSGEATVTISGGGGSFPTPSIIDTTNDASLPGAIFTGGSTTVWGLDNMFIQPIYVPATITVTAMQVRLSEAGTAGSVARLGIFNTTSALAGGGNRVLDAGTVAADSTGVKTITGLSQVLTAGWYFLVMVHNSAANPTFVHYLYHNAANGSMWRGHDLSSSGLDYINNTFTYAALAATAPASPTSTYSNGYGTRAFIFLRWT